MLNSSQSKSVGDSPRPVGELRAFVATNVGGRSWVVDLLPNYELTIGSDQDSDIRLDVPEVAAKHAMLYWSGEQLTLTEFGAEDGVYLNGEIMAGTASFQPGDEIEVVLPDTPPKVAKAVVERLLETSATEGAHVGLAVAPLDGDDAEVLVRAARDALA